MKAGNIVEPVRDKKIYIAFPELYHQFAHMESSHWSPMEELKLKPHLSEH